MLLTTIALATSLAGQPTTTHATSHRSHELQTSRFATSQIATSRFAVVELHSMTEEEKQTYPGRERFDKTEWYESCFKSVRAIIAPEHVDEWKNGGVDAT
jgi:hypothetical protein